MNEIDPSTLSDLGTTIALLVALSYIVKQVWGSVWPWFVNSYWPAKEKRWEIDKQQAQKLVERFLDAQEKDRISGFDDMKRSFINVLDSITLVAQNIETLQQRVDKQDTNIDMLERTLKDQTVMIAADISMIRDAMRELAGCMNGGDKTALRIASVKQKLAGKSGDQSPSP